VTQLSFLRREIQIIKLYLRCIFRVKDVRIDGRFVSSALRMFEFVLSLQTKMNSCYSRLTLMFKVATEISIFRPQTGHGARLLAIFSSFG